MKILLAVIAILAIFIVPNVVIDQSDRSAIVAKMGCKRSDIDRIFFHFSGRDARMYKVRGEKVFVNGVFWKVVAKVQ